MKSDEVTPAPLFEHLHTHQHLDGIVHAHEHGHADHDHDHDHDHEPHEHRRHASYVPVRELCDDEIDRAAGVERTA